MFQNVSDEAISASDSASFIIAQMVAFGIEAENSSHIIDAINATSNNFAVSSGQLANSLGIVSSTASAMGNSMEETLGMMTAITEQTRNSTKAARGLNTVFNNLAQVLDDSSSNGKKIAEIFDNLGVSMYDTDGQLLSSYELLSNLNEKWDGLDTNTKNYIASTIAGTNQLNNFLALMNNFDHAVEATETALNSAGSAANENAKYMEGLEAKTNQVKATFQELANNVIDSELVKSILDLANAFLQLANTDIGQIVTQIGLLTGLLWGGTSLISAMKILPAMFSAFATSTTAASGAVTALGIASKSAFPLLLGLSAAIVGVYHGVKWLKGKWDEAHPSAEQLNQDLNEYNTKLQENNARLEELSKIPMSNRTSEINEEVAALKEENAELEKNIGLTQQKAAETEFEDIAKSDKYKTEKPTYSIYGGNISYDLNSIDEVTARLENAEGVSEDIRRRAAEINDEFRETGGIIDGSIQNKFDSIIKELEEAGYVVEEVASGYYDFDTSITQLVDRYDELAYKVKNNIDMTADERVEFTDLQGTLTELYNDLNAAKEAHVELDGAQNQVHYRIEQLIPGFEDLSFKVWNLNGEVNAAEYYLGVLSSGMGVNKTQVDILSSAYPTLTSYIQENNGMYYLNIEALDNAAKAGDVWAQRLVGQQKQATEAAIKYGNMRLDAMVQEAKAAGKQYGYESDEYKEAKAIADQQLNEIHAAQIAMNRLKAGLSSFSYVPTGGKVNKKTHGIPPPSGSGSKGSSGSGGSSTKAAQEENDILKKRKELYQDQLDIMEHQLFLMEKQGRSDKDRIAYMKKIQAYLSEQANWYRKQGETEDSEYIRDLQEQWWNYYDQIKDLQREAFDERLEESENYIDKRNDLDDWGADNEIKAWNRVVKWMDEWYKNGLIDYEYYLEKRTEAAENAAKAEKEAWEEAQDATISWIEDEIDKLESLFDAVANKAQDEIDALEDQKDAIDEKYQEQINALEEVNEELENQIALEEALDELARARQTKVMVYKDGRFQYVQDIDKVSEAQAAVESLQREEQLRQEIENLENQRDKEKAVLDEKIKYWQEYVDKYGNYLDDYLEEQSIGVKLEGENWELSLKNFEDYVREYEELQRRLAAAQNAQFGVQSKPSGTDWSGMWWDVENDSSLSEAEKDKLQDWIHSQKEQEMAGTGAVYNPNTGTWSGGQVSSSIEAPPPSSSGSSSSGGIGGALGAIGGAIGSIIGGIFGGKHANGTLSAPGGISLVGEKGAEMRVLNPGDGIIPAKQTANLWNWGNVAPADFMNQVKKDSGTNVYIDKFNPNLPNVKNGQDFVNYLTRHFVPMVVQAQH